jgi:ribonucleotide reductase alpha subunit
MTLDGEEDCSRVYFNGIRPIFKLQFSDLSEASFTGNHKLLSLDSQWVSVEDMPIGIVFNNSVSLISKEQDGVDFVLDMEVPNRHHYILENGICSHNSSFILGQVSQSIEPLNSNYFVKKLAKGSFTFKNPYLKEILKKYKNDTDEVWKSILIRGGSVQHLDFLSSDEKDVFKTFGEISQKEIIIQAAQRQKFIDQSQSLNIMIPPDIKPKEVSDLLIEAWKMGIKTLYYQRSANPAQELSRNLMTCTSCES